ncbi:P2Y purinoceptor 13 [Hyla sarda]|uniref:P2Y purinoceptor 13 n=1 Tax=Hyla sarda TaxID=327740 RepID=UPI0024C270A4|nr:P2Y purinoceptor 13 [Hyla sarda]XP_056420943.1 P2Y purinoceptor 13 [Hyla sarda]XP_056420944.1 P2Y purinoceptor 13 [Hyla sarda]
MNPEKVNTTNTSTVNCSRDGAHIVFPILYTIIFFLGIILNCLSAWIFFKIPSKSVFIVYLKNTVVADILMTLMLPFKILADSSIGPWQIKAFVCRFSAVIFYETMYINIILLGLIGVDRFLKIVKPFDRKRINNISEAKKISVAVWMVIFLISLPNMILTSQEATPQSVRKCSNLKTPLGIKWHEAVNYICTIIFWFVFISMTLFYTIISKKVYKSYINSRSNDISSRNKTRCKVFIVVAVFFLCFAPFHFLRLPYTFSQVGIITDCQLKNKLYVAKETTLWIAATNVLMDPLIYVMLCKPFRKLIPGFNSSTNSSLETHF